MNARPRHRTEARSTRRRASRSLRAVAVVVAVVPVALVSGCSRPVDAGYAGADEFEAWVRAHPSDDYDVVGITGINVGPFSGTLEIVVSADGSAPLARRMGDAARAVCEFEPLTEGLSLKGLSFRSERLTVPLACPRDGVVQWAPRIVAQADLLDELGAVPGMVSLDWSSAPTGGSFSIGVRKTADVGRITRRVERIAAAHPGAFEDGADIFVSVGGGIR